MQFRTATANDLTQITSLLKQNNLPFEDCAEHLKNFIVLENEQKIIGTGGLEIYGNIGLLRSIAVLPEFQNQGLGENIYLKIKTFARSCNINQLFLLTETADHYFAKHGFKTVNRESVPNKIRKTEQFSGLCPTSAIVMSCNI